MTFFDKAACDDSLSADLAGYEMIEGFQNKGDDLMPGAKARWTLAEPEPAV